MPWYDDQKNASPQGYGILQPANRGWRIACRMSPVPLYARMHGNEGAVIDPYNAGRPSDV